MNKYRVGFWYTQYGTAIVEANSVDEAETKLYSKLDEDVSLSGITYESTDRDIGTQDAELTN